MLSLKTRVQYVSSLIFVCVVFMRWAGHVARMEEGRGVHKVLVPNKLNVFIITVLWLADLQIKKFSPFMFETLSSNLIIHNLCY